MIDFDLYGRLPNGNLIQKARRYAYLFTSRGCPYKCSYCHDIFGKKFKAQSVEKVLAEINYLVETHGVTEFHLMDDIFNFDKERLISIMNGVHERWGNKLHFCFPNGVRADILNEEVLDALARAGTFSMAIAVETVTQRLQRLIKKHLQIDKAFWAIKEATRRGIATKGFFMLGFPT